MRKDVSVLRTIRLSSWNAAGIIITKIYLTSFLYYVYDDGLKPYLIAFCKCSVIYVH